MDLEHTQLPEISTEHDSQRMDTDGAVLRDVRGAPKRLENVNEQRLDDECVEPEDVVVVDNGAQKPRRPRRRKPAARGGARRVLKRNAENRNAQSKSRGARITRARIVCHKRTGRWEIAVIPAPGVVVRGESERHSAGMRGEFAPTKFRSVVLIEYEVGGQVERIPLCLDEPMVFRLNADWQGTGRKVGGVGTGHFIVIAPAGWMRLGDVPVEPEPCVDSEFRAHYYFNSRGDGLPVEGFDERGVSSSVIMLYGDRALRRGAWWCGISSAA